MRQAAFPFEVLDVKEALVGALHVYELDLMNRRGSSSSCASLVMLVLHHSRMLAQYLGRAPACKVRRACACFAAAMCSTVCKLVCCCIPCLQLRELCMSLPAVWVTKADTKSSHRGSIEAAFQLRPRAPSPGGPVFQLEPLSGLLPVGAAMVRTTPHQSAVE